MYEALLTRRSVRKYSDRPVEEEKLDKVLTAGLYAPTGMNNQAPILVAGRDTATRDKLSRMNAAVMGASGDPFYGAPCVIVVLSDPERMTWVEDGSLVLGNLMNAAHSLGLGSCWIHRAKECFDTQEGKALLRAWGVPENYRGVGNCILGYAAEEPEAKPRKSGRIIKI
mgnify:FL=1